MPQNVHIRDTIKFTGYKRSGAPPQAKQPEK
jgi:hypothetical protein